MRGGGFVFYCIILYFIVFFYHDEALTAVKNDCYFEFFVFYKFMNVLHFSGARFCGL